MIDKALRAPKEFAMALAVRGPIRRIHPTTVTVLAALVGLAAAGAAWQGAYLGAIGVLTVYPGPTRTAHA